MVSIWWFHYPKKRGIGEEGVAGVYISDELPNLRPGCTRVYLIGQNFDGQNCRNFGLVSEFCPKLLIQVSLEKNSFGNSNARKKSSFPCICKFKFRQFCPTKNFVRRKFCPSKFCPKGNSFESNTATFSLNFGRHP